MKFEVYAICYNEEILLPYFLRHYGQFCDRIVIYDNYSTDRSEEICRSDPKVEIIKYDSGGQVRDDIYLQIKNNCWKGSTADWVIVCDIDEFVVWLPPAAPGRDFEELTAGYTAIIPNWWEMVSEELPTGTGQIYDEIDKGVNLGGASKCCIFRPSSFEEIGYKPGAHGVDPAGDFRWIQTPRMGILHYKNISLDYVIRRHALLASRLSEINKKNRWGFHYEQTPAVIGDYYRSLLQRREKLNKEV